MKATMNLAKSAAPTSTDSRCVLIVVRHGERLDSVTKGEGGNWLVGQDRPFDTPLTEHGRDQARRLGDEISKQVKTLGLPPIAAVYTSPFLRCRQTAAALRQALVRQEEVDGEDNGDYTLPLVRIEAGLSESLNESWFRSWSLPGADGTWNYGSGDRKELDPETIHPLSKQSVLPLLVVDKQEDLEETDIDPNYQSRTSITTPYCFHPKLLESQQDQRDRMRQAISTLQEPSRTIVLVSHGGPITHLFEDLTGSEWQAHGESSFCCYSIYRQANQSSGAEGSRGVATEWEALVVNESSYLHEKLATDRHV